MKLVLTIKEKDIIIEMSEARKIYDDLKQIFDKKIEHPYTGIRETTRTYEPNLTPFHLGSTYKTVNVTTAPTMK